MKINGKEAKELSATSHPSVEIYDDNGTWIQINLDDWKDERFSILSEEVKKLGEGETTAENLIQFLHAFCFVPGGGVAMIRHNYFKY